MKKLLLGCALAAASWLLTAAASAEVKKTQHADDGSSAYEFRDDLLNSDVGLPPGGTIVVRPQAARMTLLRPRVSFVSELLKSVENL